MNKFYFKALLFLLSPLAVVYASIAPAATEAAAKPAVLAPTPIAALAPAAAQFDPSSFVTIPRIMPGFRISGSLLWLEPSSDNLNYAVLSSPLAVPVPFANWRAKYINPRHNIGFDLALAYNVPCSANDIQLTWTHLDSNDSESVVAGANQFVGPFYQLGPDALTLRAAHGSAAFRFNMVDLDVGQYVNFGGRMQLRLFAGLSAGRIKAKLESTVNNPVFALTSENISTFTAIGPRFGVRAIYDLCYGFGLVGQFASSVLVGTMKSSMSFNSTSPALTAIGIPINLNAIDADNSTQVVPSFDTRLGIGYITNYFQSFLFSAELGYRAAVYVHSINQVFPQSVVVPVQTGTVAVNTMDQAQSNFGFNGPYLNITIKI